MEVSCLLGRARRELVAKHLPDPTGHREQYLLPVDAATNEPGHFQILESLARVGDATQVTKERPAESSGEREPPQEPQHGLLFDAAQQVGVHVLVNGRGPHGEVLAALQRHPEHRDEPSHGVVQAFRGGGFQVQAHRLGEVRRLLDGEEELSRFYDVDVDLPGRH